MKKPTHYRAEKVQKFIELLKKRVEIISSVSDTTNTHIRIQELEYVINELEKEFYTY